MTALAIFCGAAGLLAGLVKFLLDFFEERKERERPPVTTISVGNQSIDVPSSFTAEQIQTVLSLLKDNATQQATTTKSA